ncbi:MAG: OadG family protein [Clostridia bacterium]|nr:OadG family protein [Clostridia bacterium]
MDVGKLGLGTALLDAILGYMVVFIGLALLMCVITIVGKVMVSRAKSETAAKAAATPAPAAPKPAAAPKKLAPGSAGELKLYDTDPRDAAMIMAIVAHKLQKPLNELRFKSIKEVK